MLNQRLVCDDSFYKWRLVVRHPGADADGRIVGYLTYQNCFTDFPETALMICAEKEAKRLARKTTKFWSMYGPFTVLPEQFNPKTLKPITPMIRESVSDSTDQELAMQKKSKKFN